MTRRAMGGHHSAAAITTTWLTPPPIIAALGGAESFDLDPCAVAGSPIATARAGVCLPDDGLAADWFGRVWLNPPYTSGELGDWLGKLADHDRGTALIFARTETDAFQEHVFGRATGLLWLAGRLHFHYPDAPDIRRCQLEPHEWEVKAENAKANAYGCKWCGVAKANAGAPSVLCAYGDDDLERLAASDLPGNVQPLRFARFVVISAAASSSMTWRAAVLAYVGRQRGSVSVSDLYRHFARHPKAKGLQHWRAKVRQTLQRLGAERVGPGQWSFAHV